MKFAKLQELAAREGLTLAKLAVLECIVDGPATMSDLADVAKHSTAAATGMADRLEKAGLADRVRINPKDRREIRLVPTMEGREVFARFETAALDQEVAV